MAEFTWHRLGLNLNGYGLEFISFGYMYWQDFECLIVVYIRPTQYGNHIYYSIVCYLHVLLACVSYLCKKQVILLILTFQVLDRVRIRQICYLLVFCFYFY